MGNQVFNIAKGRFVEWYSNVENNSPANSAFVVVLLKSSGLEADDTLNNYDTLADLLAAANDECDFTNYARKTLTDSDLAAVPAPDDTNNRRDIDVPDLQYVNAGGATNNTVGCVVFCYDSDTTAGTDANIIPMTFHTITWTTDGNTTNIVIDAAGLARAA